MAEGDESVVFPLVDPPLKEDYQVEDAWAVDPAVKTAAEEVLGAPFGEDLLVAVQKEAQAQPVPAGLVRPMTGVLVQGVKLAQLAAVAPSQKVVVCEVAVWDQQERDGFWVAALAPALGEGGLDLEEGGLDLGEGGLNHGEGGLDPEEGGLDPGECGLDPEKGGLDPGQGGLDPGEDGLDPEEGGLDRGEEGGLDPEEGGLDPGEGDLDPGEDS